MKIVVCANTSWYVYNFRKNLMQSLRQHGYDVYAIAPVDRDAPKIEALGVRWLPLPLHQTSINPLRELKTLAHLAHTLRAIQPDHVFTFTAKCNIYAGMLCQVLSFGHIANISGVGEVFDRNNALTRVTQTFYRHALRNTQKIFFQNNEDLDNFLRLRLFSPSQCERLPGSGVDISTFTPHERKDGPDTPRRFLMHGRLLPQKGYDLFLQAAQRIRARCREHAEFWILGIQDSRRSASRQLFEKILDYHKRGIVTMFPETDNVLPFLHQADVVVLPSHYHEGVPRSLLEALACGKPVITTDWKGCRDTVEHGLNGLLVPPGDPDALEQAFRFFLEADQTSLIEMGRASRQKAVREFDEQHVIDRYLSVMRE